MISQLSVASLFGQAQTDQVGVASDLRLDLNAALGRQSGQRLVQHCLDLRGLVGRNGNRLDGGSCRLGCGLRLRCSSGGGLLQW